MFAFVISLGVSFPPSHIRECEYKLFKVLVSFGNKTKPPEPKIKRIPGVGVYDD